MSFLTTELGSFMRPLSDHQAAIRNILEDDDDDEEVVIQEVLPRRGARQKENSNPNSPKVSGPQTRSGKRDERTPKDRRLKSPNVTEDEQQTTPARMLSKKKGTTKPSVNDDDTTPSRSRRQQKATTPVVETPPKAKGRKDPREKKRPRSSASAAVEGESLAERSRKESPKGRKAVEEGVAQGPKVAKKPGRKSTVSSMLQIDMVPGAFQPETPKRKRRSPAKLIYAEDSSPDFVERKPKKSGAGSKTTPAVSKTPAAAAKPKAKLKVSTIKNYESDQDISSAEDSDVYKSGQDQESSTDEEVPDEDLETVHDDKKKKKKQKDKKKKEVKTKAVKRVMTPRVPRRTVPLPDVVSPLAEAQLRLHVGAVPDSLPCREDEFAEIFSFTEGKVQEGIGGCMYISGLPGTGKTATVKEVIRTLEEDKKDGGLPDFNFIEVNGMRLTEPNQAYVQIWQGLNGGEKVTAEHARNLLEKRFTSADKKSQKKTVTTVLVVDELDMLWNRKQSVLYNIFEWPTYKWAKLVVLAIANTMDLPERVMINRVSSRIGLTRLNFSPYTHEQLTEIVAARLHGLTVFDKDAVNLVARKVSSLSGDARRALDICRRATEIAQRDHEKRQQAAAAGAGGKAKKKKDDNEDDDDEESVVGMAHVTQAHREMFCSPKMMAIRCCSPFEKMFLQTLVAIFEKTGIEETSLGRARELLSELAMVDGYPPVSVTRAHSVLARLVGMRLVLGEPGKSGRLDMKVRLNVSTDDVNFAMKKDYA